ncbi:MAG TPA: hypothetical protein PLB24_00920 [Comamonas denitrificans]|nr:hypothetical protein [Comamonas denitrificans]
MNINLKGFGNIGLSINADYSAASVAGRVDQQPAKQAPAFY